MATISDVLTTAMQHHQAGRLQAAEQIYRQVLAQYPNQAEALHLLGLVGHQVGRHENAIELIERAIRLQGTVAAFHCTLGEAYWAVRKYREAIACCERALELQPDYPEAHNTRGNALGCQGQYAEAAACYRHAVRLKPDFAEAHNNLGNVLGCQGRLAEAIASYRQALHFKPDQSGFHSNLLYILYFSPEYDAQGIFEEHRRWNQQHAKPLTRIIEPHENDPSPNRRLRIGYVSPDFFLHPVGRFLLPLLQEHDHAIVQVFCYSLVRAPDEIMERCQSHADVWRNCVGLSDEQLAQTIRQDHIDILVDLTMHMPGNRVLVFARKPAPVQVTYLAYCGTTGLGAMDYRLTDRYLDVYEPEDRRQKKERSRNARDEESRCYAEESIWLPQTYWCYQPLPQAPEVNRLPALDAQVVTFGCLNNFSKVTEPTLATWSRLLQALPQARLLLHADAASRARVQDFLAAHHVAPERLTFVDRTSIAEYFKTHERIDIALDPFPYGGGTTTCDALWMGIPVVTLAGQTGVGRGGLSILSNVGLPDLVADDTDLYVRIAVVLASDLPRLRELRATLRGRMQASPLMDAPRFARAVEAAYRDMWRRWCERQKEEDSRQKAE